MILAFVSRKGGVGKTTSTVNLAGALARLGSRVLVVDLDCQACASRSLGIERGALAPSIHDVLFRNLPLPEAVRRTALPGLDLVTASADLIDADLDLQNVRRREERLLEVLEPHASGWDWILLDAPPAFGGLTRNALLAADAYVLPTPPHFLAFEGLDVVIDAAARLHHRHGRPDALAGILLTMVDYRTASARTYATELRLQYGLRVFDTEIPINVRLAESPARGATIFETDPRAAGAHAYRLLATELLSRFAAGEEAGDATVEAERPASPASGDARAAKRAPRKPEPGPAEAPAAHRLRVTPADADEIPN
jgi:chromosome partitioning protein